MIHFPTKSANSAREWAALSSRWRLESISKLKKSRVKLNSSREWLSELSAPQRVSQQIDTRISFEFAFHSNRETRNRSVIDNMQEKLAQTNKKMIEVKKKCTAATQHCLRVQLESVSGLEVSCWNAVTSDNIKISPDNLKPNIHAQHFWINRFISSRRLVKTAQHNNNRFTHLIPQLIANTTSSKSNEIGHELGIIKSNFGREIAALKSTVSGNVARLQRHDMESSYASSSSTSSSSTRKTSSESIKSTIQWNEKMADIAFDDKFSTIIDDEMESGDDRRRLMTKAEIDNDASAYGRIRSAPSLMTLPQERSFN